MIAVQRMFGAVVVLVGVQVFAQDGGADALSEVAAVDGGTDEVQAQRERDRLGGESAAALLGQETAAGKFTFAGTVEAFYQWNFNQPSDQVTAFRGFDNRHNTFTIANAVLDARWDFKQVVGRLALQIGHTPSTYYLAEPGFGPGAGTNATGIELWKYLQQANVGYSFDIGRGVLVDTGIFLSPIGPEAMQVKDNWNFSRSNLFYGLPYYHTGVRVSVPLSDRWTVTVAGFNGWNSVVDGNDGKSLMAQGTYTIEGKLAASFLYFGGPERPRGAAEGQPWRHLVDAHVTWITGPRFSLLVHANAGAEPNARGLSGWVAGALYGRVTLTDWLFVAGRADVFVEQTPTGAASIFWAAPWMASQTLTVEAKPHPQVSARLEYRHDEAGGPVFSTRNGPLTGPRQDTLTLGLTTWF
ncbi:MAG: outer membrane beta-barrel protein [Myxococcales bacterium]|nr:outer membrane beta-barrel protein [Myxococcales bacterium]